MNIRKRKVEFVVVKKFSSKFVKLDLVLSFLVVVLLLKDWGFDCRFIVVVLQGMSGLDLFIFDVFNVFKIIQES